MTLETAYGTRQRRILPRTAYGSIKTESMTPVVQFTGTYGILNKVNVTELLGGTAIASNSVFTANSGSNANGFASILSRRQVTYRSGQGILARWTATFDAAGRVDGFSQSGLITSTDRLGFGYKELQFGILFATRGETEIQELTITTPSTGSENATITIDSVPLTVPLTAGTVQHNAVEIAVDLNSQLATYDFTANNDQVVARSLFPDPGTFAFASGTAVATWARVQAGSQPVDQFIPQSQWNIDTRPNLDVTKGNIYQVQLQFLGHGAISFSIEDPETGDIELVHVIKYANNFIVPNIGNPSFRIGWACLNFGNTDPITLSGSSAAMMNEGMLVVTEQPRSVFQSANSVGTTNFINIMTIRNRLVLNDKRNRVELVPRFLFALTDSTKGAIIEISTGAVFSDELDFSYVDKDTSVAELATNAVTVTGGRLLASLPTPQQGTRLNLEELGVFLFPGETLTISARVISGAASDVTVTLNFIEDL